jgi:DNA-binding transcriptional ArsR family regulator
MQEKEKIFKVLGSYARLKILATLTAHIDEELTLYKIAQFSKLKKESIRYNLPLLLRAGLVQEKTYGASRLYSLNQNNPIAKQWVEFISKARLL